MNAKEDEIFFEKLKSHPRLKKRFNEILEVAENTSGELITADQAEIKAIEEVLQRIKRRLPPDWKVAKDEESDEDTPVEKCYRYLDNRKDYLDYKDAIEKKLPIGSGEIESSHRYIIQKRLKIAGAWWKHEIAECMLNLRVLRANNDWEEYWQYQRKAA